MSFLWLTPLSSYSVEQEEKQEGACSLVYILFWYCCLVAVRKTIYIVRFNPTWHHNNNGQSTMSCELRLVPINPKWVTVLWLKLNIFYIVYDKWLPAFDWLDFQLNMAHLFYRIRGNCCEVSSPFRAFCSETVVNDWCDKAISRHSQKEQSQSADCIFSV